ncbi:MAG: phosphatase PAP2 family protein [Candidatus Moranbacteria bacterium]|nr:phosphatase PAP2 family protein [Candidatus Moranbacteria bacterium]
MDSLIIFGAKYLYLVIVIISLAYLVAVPKSRSSQVIVAALIALPLTYIIAKIMSALYFDPRPFVVGNFIPLIPHAPDNGFPSDHTLLSAAIAAVMFAFDRKIGVLLFLIAFLVGLARVYAGVHHLTDILGSIIIAAIVTYCVMTFLLPSVWKYMPRPVRNFFD